MATKKWGALSILLLSALMVVTDVFISNIALPSVKTYFHATNAEIEMVIAGYLIGYAVFLIAGGRSGDRFGKKRIFILGLLGFSIFSVLCAVSTGIHELVIFRFLEGVSSAFMSPQAIAMIQLTFRNPEERSKAFGFFGVTLGLAVIVGVLSSYLLFAGNFPVASWRLAFLITPMIGIIAIVLSIRHLEETERDLQQGFDLKGLAILTIGLISLIYPIIEGRQLGWPAWSIFLLTGSIAVLYGFVRYQLRRRRYGYDTLIDMRVFRQGHFSIGLLVVLCAFAAHNAFILVYMLFIRHFAGPGFLSSVFPLTFYGLGFMISAFVSIKYIPRFGRSVLQFGIAIMIASLLLQIAVVYSGADASLFFIALFIYGMGQGMFLPSLLNVTLTGIPKSFSGAAAGIYYTFQQFSSTFGVAVIGGIFFSVLENKQSAYPYRLAFDYGIISIVACLTAAIILLQRIPLPEKAREAKEKCSLLRKETMAACPAA